MPGCVARRWGLQPVSSRSRGICGAAVAVPVARGLYSCRRGVGRGICRVARGRGVAGRLLRDCRLRAVRAVIVRSSVAGRQSVVLGGLMPKLRRARVDVSRHHLPSGRLLPVVRVLHGAAGPLCASNELRWQQRSVNFSGKKQKVHVHGFSPCVRRQRGARRPPASQRTTPPQPVDARRCVEVLRRCSLRLAPRGWRPRPAIARAARSRGGRAGAHPHAVNRQRPERRAVRSRALLAGCPTAISHWSGQRRALSATGNSGLRACGAPAPWATAVKVQCMRAKPQTVATSQNKRVRMRRNVSFTLGAGVRTRAHTTRGPLWWARLKHGIALGALVACRLPAGPALYIPRATSCMCPPFAGRAAA